MIPPIHSQGVRAQATHMPSSASQEAIAVCVMSHP